MLYGVDIHARYQGGIDLALLKRQGYTFMCTKASEGTSIPSAGGLSSAGFAARMLEWVAEARRLGMVPGLYHWLKAGNAKYQAQFFHALVERAGGPAGMLIQLDCEDNATYPDVVEWADEWKRLTGGHPILLYTGKWWWAPRGWDGNRITPLLWDSHYLTADTDTIPDDPAAFAGRVPASWWTPGYGNWSAATILQFTSQGDAGSLGNNVDLNAFRGTREQLIALTGGDDMSWKEILGTAQTNPDSADAGALLVGANIGAMGAWNEAKAMRAELIALRTVIEHMGRGSVDTAEILAGVDERLAPLKAEIRDAIADLGEGGAAQVRADAP